MVESQPWSQTQVNRKQGLRSCKIKMRTRVESISAPSKPISIFTVSPWVEAEMLTRYDLH